MRTKETKVPPSEKGVSNPVRAPARFVRGTYERQRWLRPYLEDVNQLAHDRVSEWVQADTEEERVVVEMLYRHERNGLVMDATKRVMLETAMHAGLIAGGVEGFNFASTLQVKTPHWLAILLLGVVVVSIRRLLWRKRE